MLYIPGNHTGEVKKCEDFRFGVRRRINASVSFLDKNKSKGLRIQGGKLTQDSVGSLLQKWKKRV